MHNGVVVDYVEVVDVIFESFISLKKMPPPFTIHEKGDQSLRDSGPAGVPLHLSHGDLSPSFLTYKKTNRNWLQVYN